MSTNLRYPPAVKLEADKSPRAKAAAAKATELMRSDIDKIRAPHHELIARGDEFMHCPRREDLPADAATWFRLGQELAELITTEGQEKYVESAYEVLL